MATRKLRLNNKTLNDLPRHVQQPGYARADVGIGQVHIGPGAFHRAHQAVYTDAALGVAVGNWAICGISLHSSTIREALAPQDNLYTLACLDDTVSYRVVGAVRELLVAPHQKDLVEARLMHTNTKVVTLTITEKGYCLTPDGKLDLQHPDIAHDLHTPDTPQSAIGLLVRAIAARRDQGVPPFVPISCDNLSNNGVKLKSAIVAYASELDKDLGRWIDDTMSFPRTMVDAITPATDDALRTRVATDLGLTDALPVQREAFSQWIIEDFEGDRPCWEEVGVQVTSDIEPFEEAKLRLLNAPHSALAYLGSLLGYRSVSEAMADDALQGFLFELTEQDLIPSLTPPKDANGTLDLRAYRDAIMQRFQNKEIVHLLSQIAWDGSQKIPQRLFPALRQNIKAGRDLKRLSLIVVAWRRFCMMRLARDKDLVDPLSDVLSTTFISRGNGVRAAGEILALNTFVPKDLASDERFRHALIQGEEVLASGTPRDIKSALMSRRLGNL